MGDDDIGKLYEKLNTLAVGQGKIEVRLDGLVSVANENKTTLARINANGCLRGQQDRRDIDQIRASISGRELTRSTDEKNDDEHGSWLEISKGTLKAHGSTAIIVVAILVSMWYLRQGQVQPATVVNADAQLKHFIAREVSQAVTDAKNQWEKEHK